MKRIKLPVQAGNLTFAARILSSNVVSMRCGLQTLMVGVKTVFEEWARSKRYHERRTGSCSAVPSPGRGIRRSSVDHRADLYGSPIIKGRGLGLGPKGRKINKDGASKEFRARTSKYRSHLAAAFRFFRKFGTWCNLEGIEGDVVEAFWVVYEENACIDDAFQYYQRLGYYVFRPHIQPVLTMRRKWLVL